MEERIIRCQSLPLPVVVRYSGTSDWYEEMMGARHPYPLTGRLHSNIISETRSDIVFSYLFIWLELTVESAAWVWSDKTCRQTRQVQ
jgi:hypothetical protein